MVAVVEIANLQSPRKKITVEYLVWFMENILGSRLCDIIEAGFEVYADYAVCLFIHVI